MNAKQARFVAEYLIDNNATQAAVRAGYSAKTANQQGPRLLVTPGVSAAIAKGQAAVQSALKSNAVVTKEKLTEKWWSIHDSAMGDNPIVDRYGNPTGTVQKNYAGANKALEMLARLHGLLVEVTATIPAESWDEIVKGVYGRKSGAKDGGDRPLH